MARRDAKRTAKRNAIETNDDRKPRSLDNQSDPSLLHLLRHHLFLVCRVETDATLDVDGPASEAESGSAEVSHCPLLASEKQGEQLTCRSGYLDRRLFEWGDDIISLGDDELEWTGPLTHRENRDELEPLVLTLDDEVAEHPTSHKARCPLGGWLALRLAPVAARRRLTSRSHPSDRHHPSPVFHRVRHSRSARRESEAERQRDEEDEQGDESVEGAPLELPRRRCGLKKVQ